MSILLLPLENYCYEVCSFTYSFSKAMLNLIKPNLHVHLPFWIFLALLVHFTVKLKYCFHLDYYITAYYISIQIMNIVISSA